MLLYLGVYWDYTTSHCESYDIDESCEYERCAHIYLCEEW